MESGPRPAVLEPKRRGHDRRSAGRIGPPLPPLAFSVFSAVLRHVLACALDSVMNLTPSPHKSRAPPSTWFSQSLLFV